MASTVLYVSNDRRDESEHERPGFFSFAGPTGVNPEKLPRTTVEAGPVLKFPQALFSHRVRIILDPVFQPPAP